MAIGRRASPIGAKLEFCDDGDVANFPTRGKNWGRQSACAPSQGLFARAWFAPFSFRAALREIAGCSLFSLSCFPSVLSYDPSVACGFSSAQLLVIMPKSVSQAVVNRRARRARANGSVDRVASPPPVAAAVAPVDDVAPPIASSASVLRQSFHDGPARFRASLRHGRPGQVLPRGVGAIVAGWRRPSESPARSPDGTG